MAPDDDGELMLRYARGDMRAFETLYSRHRAALYRYLARQTRNAEAANDLFQEVWSKVIVSRERYEPRAPFRTFLYRIARNCFIDHCRRPAVRLEGGGAEDGWESNLPGPDQLALYPRPPHKLVEYYNDPTVWTHKLTPVLHERLGPLWPVILGVVIVGLVVMLVGVTVLGGLLRCERFDVLAAIGAAIPDGRHGNDFDLGTQR